MTIVYNSELEPNSFLIGLRKRILKRWPGGVVATTRNGVPLGGAHVEVLSNRTRLYGPIGASIVTLNIGNSRHGRDLLASALGASDLKAVRRMRRAVGAMVAGRMPAEDDAIAAKYHHATHSCLALALERKAARVARGEAKVTPFEKVYNVVNAVLGHGRGGGIASNLAPASDCKGSALHADSGEWAVDPAGISIFYRDVPDDYSPFRTATGAAAMSMVRPEWRPGTTSVYVDVVATYAHRNWLVRNNYFWDGVLDAYVHPDYRSDEDGEDEDGLCEYHSDSSRRHTCVRRHPSMESDALKDDTITLGFEAEIQVPERYSCIKALNADEVLRSVTVLEHDGSLNEEDGFETITGWSTMPTVVEWGERYCNVVSRQGYYTDSAGLHIAVGGLTQLHVARVYGFVFDRGNRPLLRDMAGRDYNSYSTDFYFMKEVKGAGYEWERFRTVERPAPTAFTSRKIAANMAIVAKKSASQGRYSALNYRRGGGYDGTLEWRLFEATGNATRMTARLQFVWAVSKYTDPALCNPLTTDGFLRALVTDPLLRRHTEALREYIVRTAAHQCRFPAFARAVTELRQRKEKKAAHLAKGSAPVAATPPSASTPRMIAPEIMQVVRPTVITLTQNFVA